MIAVVQRVSEARVRVDGRIVGEISEGLLVLASVERDDGDEQINWMADKLVHLRIFRNNDKHFDLDVLQVGGGILLISNFTVSADARYGRRPSLSNAASPELAESRFQQFVEAVRSHRVHVATGIFGADMKVESINDGPATFIVETD